MTKAQANRKFKSEVVKFACEVYQTAAPSVAKSHLAKALNDVNAIGAESLRGLALDAAGL